METFAYSYYQYRPVAHNLTSEWDFLYNKAHNEYLNYLATTGIVGLLTYLAVILTFVVWSGRKILNLKSKNSLLIAALLGSYVSYLVYNFFLFSVVIIAIFFYLFPALVFIATDSLKLLKFPITNLIYRRPIYTKLTQGIIILSTTYLLFSVFKLWYADTIFNSGEKASDLGNPGRAYNLLTIATDLNPGEPFYRSELAYAAAAASASLKETDATLSSELKDEALAQVNITLKTSPRNVSFWRTTIRTYFELTSLDKKYIDATLKALDYTITLAPTDPKLYYNKALILESQGKKDEEIKALQQVIRLKPNYLEGLDQLKQATASSKP